jgi:Spy/CpxP family protein refolding chaperone
MVRNNRTGERFLQSTECKREFGYGRGHGNFEMHISEKLGMTDSQMEKLNKFSNDFHLQKQELKENIEAVKRKYFENLATEQSNPELLSALADSLGELHSKMVKLDYQHYKNIKSICTPEQAHMMDSLGRLHMNDIRGGNCSDQKRRHKQSGGNRHMYN